MATQAIGTISSGDATYAQRYSANLYYEGIVNNPINAILESNGCINREDKLEVERGGTVTLYNQLRRQSNGNTGDGDVYSSATTTEKSSRSLVIAKNWDSITWPLTGTQTQQYAAFDIGQHNEKMLSDWAKSVVTYGYLNQLGGNTAGSITALSVSDTPFSTASGNLTRITGNNAAIAPTYWYKGSNAGASVQTSDTGITSSDTLSIKDFEAAQVIMTSQQAAKPTFQTLDTGYLGVVFLSYTGLNQLKNEAVTLGQGSQLMQIWQATAAGGKSMDLMEFMLPGINLKFIVVPDTWLPRGVVTSGLTEKANSRRCIIVGKNALDVSFGKGFAPAGGKIIPGASVSFDMEYKKLNKQGYGVAELLWGAKKTQSTGSGDGNATAYDVGTYVITHYSPM